MPKMLKLVTVPVFSPRSLRFPVWGLPALIAVCAPAPASSSGGVVGSIEELPPGATPAYYYWSKYHSGGFGPYSTKYRYGAHPGYWRRTNYNLDLDNGHGFLVDHPAAAFSIFAESEAQAIAAQPNLLAVYRDEPFDASPWGYFTGAHWAADRYDPYYDRVYYDPNYASWNFVTYSGRACPDDFSLIGVYPNGTSQPVEEFFCALDPGNPDPLLNVGNTSCSVSRSAPGIGMGNPVHLATGNKFQRVRLIQPSVNSPIEFELFYNSRAPKVAAYEKWTHTYKRSLSDVLQISLDNAAEVSSLVQGKYLSIRATRPDGRVLRFSNVMDWASRTTVDQGWSSLPGSGEKLYTVNDPVTGEAVELVLKTAGGNEETYALNGQLVSIKTVAGRTLSFTYRNNGQLEQVSDEMDRTLFFGYTGAVMTSITAVDGEVYRLNYDGHGNMAEIRLPDLTPNDDLDNPRRVLHYENPSFPTHLTGITDERGNRTATWAYDDQGRAISSEHADGTDNYTLTFNTDATTTVTDPQGRQRTYTFTTQHGVTKVASVAGGDCSSCGQDAASYSYDGNGFLARKTDFNGNVTSYIRDTRGRETSRTEGAGTPEQRTITTTWHPQFNKPETVSEPGRLTTYSYYPDGRLQSITVQPQQ